MSNKTFGRVIPGLSIKSVDLRSRLENRTLTIKEDGKVYSQDNGLVDTLRMDRAELFRSHLKDAERIGDLSRRVEADAKSQAKARAEKAEADLYAKAKAEAIAELAKAKGNG